MLPSVISQPGRIKIRRALKIAYRQMADRCNRLYIFFAVLCLSLCSLLVVASQCPSADDTQRCLGDLGMRLDDIRMRRLFGSNNSSIIEPICKSADIPGAMECMKAAIRYCRDEDQPNPQLKLIHLEGYKKAMMYTCSHLKVYRDSVEPCIMNLKSRVVRQKCWDTFSKIAIAHLEFNRATTDSRAKLCTDHRLIEYCTDVSYRKVCGDDAADYLRHVAHLTEPSSCDCATDKGYCPPSLPPHQLKEGPTRNPGDDETVSDGGSDAKVDGLKMFIILLFVLLSLL